MPSQSLKNKLGEVEFRAKLIQQQLGKGNFFPQEPDQKEFKQILKARLKETSKALTKLKREGVEFSPYLEIGAEHCLRSVLLENKFGAKGIATDISFPSLAAARDFAKEFKFKKTPKIVCADANNLPFKSNSFPFVFVYETLHHFPNPYPIISEIYRVLSPSGILFIGAEPVKTGLQITLWRRPTKLRLFEKILKYALILPFISHIGKTEVEHKILEEAFPLKIWQRALSIFPKVKIALSVYPFGKIAEIEKNSKEIKLTPLIKLALWFFGGGLAATCFKPSKQLKHLPNNLNGLLVCPNCLTRNGKEVILTKKGNAEFGCTQCKTRYPKKNNVLILVENQLMRKIFDKLL